MSYALATIWHERHRFLPAVLAVAFSAVLIVLQSGLLLGILSTMSTPVDQARADIWVTYPGVRSVDLGRGIPEPWVYKLEEQPEIEQVEPCVIGFGLWTIQGTGKDHEIRTEVCSLIGTFLDTNSIAVIEPLLRRPDLLDQLREPGAVVIDRSELGRLGVTGVGDKAEVMGFTVHIVGVLEGLKSIGGAYVFCSIDTARALLHYWPQDATYLLGKCRNRSDADRVAARLRLSPRINAYTQAQFSTRSRWHWMTTTKAGLALAFTAALGLLVGAVVTSQTLYAATTAAQREYATLRAMGIPRWRLRMSVLAQSFWVGLAGLVTAVPVTAVLSWIASTIGTAIRLNWVIVVAAAAITLVMALASGLLALRSLQQVDPVHNIR
jgi:putative ABC transport system permease protein